MSAIYWSIVLAKIDLVSINFRFLWYHSILKGSIDQYNEIHSPLACSRLLPWLPNVRRVREAWMFGLSLFRPSRQSSIPTSVPRRAMKDSNIPSPERTRSVKCPTPGPTKTIKSPPHTLPPHPPRRLYIDRCIIIDKLFIQTLIIFLLRNSLVSLRYLWRNVQKKRHARAKLLFF